MKRCLWKTAFLFLIVAFAPIPSASAQDMPGSFADLVEKLSPTVVNISTSQKVKGGVEFFGLPFEQLPSDPQMDGLRDFLEKFGQKQAPNNTPTPEREVTSLGSGFIIDAEGHIVTNNHVIEESDEITVTLSNKEKYTAKILGRDKKTDLALLKIDAGHKLPFVNFSDSDAIRVGDWVIAIGNPYGLGGSVTKGIISARQRSIRAGPYDDFLQTDAPINRGNSGGPLFDLSGRVVGINTAIFSPSGGNIGIGFAIPINIASPIIDQLKQYGRAHRAWLGVKIQEVTDEIAQSLGMKKAMGALVAEVTPESPAGAAGIRVGDIIMSFDDKQVTEMRFLPRIVAETAIGKSVKINVWRDGKSRTLTAKLEEMEEEAEADAPKEDAKSSKSKGYAGKTVLGMEVTPLDDSLRERYGVKKGINGLLVLSVTNPEAIKRGVREGNVINSVNVKPVTNVEQFAGEVASARKQKREHIMLGVIYDENETAFVTLPLEEAKKE